MNLGYSKLDNGIAALAQGERVMTNGSERAIDQQTGRLTTTYGLDLGGNSIQNVSAILPAGRQVCRHQGIGGLERMDFWW